MVYHLISTAKDLCICLDTEASVVKYIVCEREGYQQYLISYLTNERKIISVATNRIKLVVY